MYRSGGLLRRAASNFPDFSNSNIQLFYFNITKSYLSNITIFLGVNHIIKPVNNGNNSSQQR